MPEDTITMDNMENTFGVKCVSSPLGESTGQVEGAMSISTPSLRMDDEKRDIFVQILKRYANDIQKRL